MQLRKMALSRQVKLIFLVYISVSFLEAAEKITYLSVERPKVNYFNPKYMEFINLTTHRYGRTNVNPVYYVGLHFTAKEYFGNNVTINFYFLEFLSNRYQRSFVEMHFKFCDLIHKDTWFGKPMRQGNLDRPCPYPADSYHLYNMTVPPSVIPKSFPFKKGRIYANLTVHKLKEPERLADLQIDMEIREAKVNKKIIKFSD